MPYYDYECEVCKRVTEIKEKNMPPRKWIWCPYCDCGNKAYLIPSRYIFRINLHDRKELYK